ncbi:hypothetical protein [Legionella tunisiensis]|uniref:hypothetical protein n=1 Tax=Legionella tunisiensis TaxID=1034944 RepID=UPI00036A8022|nr:hypothetical protein [Legionella tunisiensis]
MIKSSDVNASATIVSSLKDPILLHMVDQNGYGDVSLAIKVAKFLFKKYPQAIIWISAKMESFEKIQEIDPEFLDSTIHPRLGTVVSGTADFLLWSMKPIFHWKLRPQFFNNSLRKAKTPTNFYW